MATPISRRSLLAAGAALTVAAACGGDDDTATTATSRSTDGEGVTPDDLEIAVGSAQLVAGFDQRITAGLLVDAEPLRLRDGVRFSFGRDPRRMSRLQPATFHDEGVPERPYYRSTFRFDQPGTWYLGVDAGGRRAATPIRVIAADDTEVPLPGDPMIAVKTPTTGDAAGVDPICTADPVCPFHDVSLDAALTAGRPVAAIFSTPAFCQTRVCGPVLDVLVNEAGPYRDRVQLVHVEVYRSRNPDFTKADSLAPDMRAYHLTFEPVLFLAGADGVLRERLDGPYDAREAREALGRLVA